MIKRLIIAITASFLVACAGTHFEWDSARKIKPGMTEREVTALMGAPYLVKSESSGVTWVWSYANSFSGVRTVSVVFVNGKVTKAPAIPESFN